jgi:hypothetical protein
VHYLLVPAVMYIENTMSIIGDEVVYNTTATEKLQKFKGAHQNYSIDAVKDSDFEEDLEILNNTELREQYWQLYYEITGGKFNMAAFNFNRIINLIQKCTKCDKNEPVDFLKCANGHKVVFTS